MKGKEPLHFISVMLHRATIIQDDAFLDILAGYGYRPMRTVLWYLGIIFLFALAYHHFGGLSLSPPDAFVYSLTSFHRRGFFPGLTSKPSLHDPLIMLAA